MVDTKKDLTRIEDLSDFEHDEDPATDDLLTSFKSEEKAATEENLFAEMPFQTTVFEDDSAEVNSEIVAESDNGSIAESSLLSDFEQSNDNVFSNEGDSDSFTDDLSDEESLPEADALNDNELIEDETSFAEESEYFEEEVSSIHENLASPLLTDADDQEIAEEADYFESTEELHDALDEHHNDDAASIDQDATSLPQMPTTPAEKNHLTGPLKEINEFAKNMSYGKMAVAGNPPYSIILKEIKYIEDKTQIMDILTEHGLLTADNKEVIATGIDSGQVLLSQLGEFSAIYLAHKLRRFNMKILFGLSDELRPSKFENKTNKGLLSKNIFTQNKRDNFVIEDQNISFDEIITVTTPIIASLSIYRYLGIVGKHTVIDQIELMLIYSNKIDRWKDSASSATKANPLNDILDQIQEISQGDLLKQEFLNSHAVYRELTHALKEQAYKLKANAIVGINFQITPLGNIFNSDGKGQYQITCTGNAVWAARKEED